MKVMLRPTGPSIRTAKVLTGAAVLIVIIGATGCGTGGDPRTRVVDAARRTLAVKGAAYDVLLSGQRLSGPSVDLPGGKAAYDLSAGIGYEALTVQPRGGDKRTLYLDFFPTKVAAAPWPTPAGILPPGKMWIAVPFAGKGAPAAGDGLLAQLEELSPELALDEIAWGAASATSAGTSTVNHVPMSRYRVSIDLKKAYDAARRRHRTAIASAIASEQRASPTGKKVIDVWVTGPGHVGRMITSMPGTGLGTATFRFSSFDSRFDHVVPPASRTVPLASITTPESRNFWALAVNP
jgi:hypothetical protein